VPRPTLAAGVLIRIVRFRLVEDSMLYWLGVYALVVAVVVAPFLLLYFVAGVGWLSLKLIHFTIRSLKNVWAMRAGFLREHWSVLHR
jgi:hypothetical protein